MKKIIFRADGNSSTGLGHLYRLFALVEIAKSSFNFIFLTHETSTHEVIPRSYEKVIIPRHVTKDTEVDWLCTRFSNNEFILVADGYHFDSKYQKQLKKKNFRFIYIDDLAQEHMYADVVINHSPYIKASHYSKEKYTKLALGTKFAMLRPSFLKESKNKGLEVSTLSDAFVCFGGADPYNLSFKCAKALLSLPSFHSIHIVLGSAYKFEEIFKLKDENPLKINIHRNLSEFELVAVMKNCNFAVVPTSTILYEICCLKIPALSGFYVDNQELIYKGFKGNNAVFGAGNMRDFTVNDFYNIVQSVLSQGNYGDISLAQSRLFDEKIASRHLKLFEELC